MKLLPASEFPGRLVKTQITRPHPQPRVPNLVGRVGLEGNSSKKSPGDTDAGLETALRTATLELFLMAGSHLYPFLPRTVLFFKEWFPFSWSSPSTCFNLIKFLFFLTSMVGIEKSHSCRNHFMMKHVPFSKKLLLIAILFLLFVDSDEK